MRRYTIGKALSSCYKRVKNKHKWHHVALIWTAFEHSLFNHANKTFERIHCYLSFLCVVIFLLFQYWQKLYFSQKQHHRQVTKCGRRARESNPMLKQASSGKGDKATLHPCAWAHLSYDHELTDVLCRDRDGFTARLCRPRKQQHKTVWSCWGSRAGREIAKGRVLKQEGGGEEAEKGLKWGHSFREYQ